MRRRTQTIVLPCLAVVAALLAATGALAAPIEIVTAQVALNPEDLSQDKVGQLRFLGGLKLRANDVEFGGLSGLSVDSAGRLTAVTDRGHWLSARIVRDAAGRLADLVDGDLTPLRGLDGKPLTGNARDAEAVERVGDGDYLVSFERHHRIWRIHVHDGNPAGLPRPLATPAGLRRSPTNGGAEAIAPLPDGRLLLLTEDLSAGDGLLAGWLIGTQTHALSIKPPRQFKPTDLAVLPNGDVLALLRYYNPLAGVAVRVQRLRRDQLKPGAPLVGEEIARFERPLTVDNYEGLATARDGDGGQLVYIVSDDNFSALQRTLLLLFRLEE